MARATVAATLVAALALASCSTQERAARPSVLLISIDTLRADHVGVYGYERETTPFLDRFATESLVFEHALAPAPWTLISHMTMLTGLFPNQHGVVTGDLALSPSTPLLAERLKDLGYQTIGLYYEGWIHPRHGFGRGFDTFESHRNAEEAEQHLTRALDELDPERPFFLFLHLFDVHSGPLDTVKKGPIYDCPPPYDSLFLKGATARLPDMPEGQLWLYKGELSDGAIEALTALYDGGIRSVDTKLESWFQDLDRRGILDRALVIVTADHGESLGQRGNGINDHGGAYQEGLHVPLLVHLPGGTQARNIQRAVHLADLVPTVLDFVGAGRDERLPGVSLLGELPAERRLSCMNPKSFEVIYRWPQKFVHLVQTERSLRVDLSEDPGETGSHPLTEAEFQHERDALLGTLSTWPAAIPVDDSDYGELAERLKEMGYVGEDH